MKLCNGLFALACVAAVAMPAPAEAQTPFYAGKQLSFLINFDAGSSTDIEARLLGRHIGKHIDGKPTIIMQNKPGAGGLTGGIFLGEVGPKDGSMVGYFTGIGWHYATQPQAFKVDLRDYPVAGYSSGSAIYFIRSDVGAGVKTPADIAKVNDFVSGGVGARSSRDFTVRATLSMLGRKHKHVSGYGSGEKAMLALQRSEIHFYSTTPPLYSGQIEPNLVKKGLVTPLFVDPSWDGKTVGLSKQVAGYGVPPFQELYRQIHGKMPEGLLWESYLTSVSLNGTLQRLVAFPPGVPDAAVQALRESLRKLKEDREFAAEATKVLGYVPEYESDANAAAAVRNVLTVRPEIRDFINKFTDSDAK